MTHEDVEFSVDHKGSHGPTFFGTFKDASSFAVMIAASGREDVTVDVLVHSEEGARALAGDDGVERYLEDPDASVFERLEIMVNNVGRVA